MDSSRITKEENEFNTLINNLRNEKTLLSLENIIEYIKSNIEKFLQNKILSYKLLDELFFFLQNNNISKPTQIDLYKYFIDLFISMKFKPEDLLKLDFLSNIFSQKSNFYTQSTSNNSLNSLLETYYNFFFPIQEIKEFEKNDIIDYLDEEENYYNWTQGEIISIDNNQIQIQLVNNKKITLNKNSFKIKPKNTFSKDDEIEWRKNLKKDDLLDCLDIGNNWMRSYVFRKFSNDITVCYQLEKDNKNIGYNNKFNKSFNIYSPKIRMIDTESFNVNSFQLYPKSPSQNTVFNEHNMHIPFNKNNYIIPLSEDKNYSFEYILICNYLMEKIVEKDFINENLPIEYFVKVIEFLSLFIKNLSVHFMEDYIPNKLFPSFIKILTDFGNDKTKQFSKVEIDKLFKRIRELMLLSYYDFDIDAIIGPFEIDFGYNCFKNSNFFEKKLIGLNIIYNSLFSNLNQEISKEKKTQISKILLSDNNENDSPNNGNDIIELLFNDMNIHVELLKKGEEIFKYLFQFNLIDQNVIDKIYTYILSNKNNNKDILNSLYLILEENSNEMSYRISTSIINKIKTINYEQLTEQDIILLTSITSKLNNFSTFKTIATDVLNYLYKYIIEFKNDNNSVMINFFSVIQNAKDLNTMNNLYIYYVKKIIEDLYENEYEIDINLLVKFLTYLFTSIDDKYQNQIKFKLSNEIFTKNDGSKKFIGKIIIYFKTSLKPNNNFNEEIFQNLMTILNISEYRGLINVNRIIEFFDIFVFEISNKKYREIFLNWIDGLHLKKFIDIYPTFDNLMEKLEIFCLSNKNKDIIDNILIKYFYNLFIDYNTKDLEPNQKSNPLEYKHFEIIWDILINFSMTPLIDDLLSNFTLRNFTLEERNTIWNDLIKYAFNFLNLDKEKNIIGTLNAILCLIYYSEYYGTANVISHESETIKQIPVNIKIINSFYNNPKSDLELKGKLFNNSTIYDLKKEISKELNIPIILISLDKIKDNKINNKLNGNLIYSLINEDLIDLSKDDNTFKITKNIQVFEEIKKYPLLENGNRNLLSERSNAVLTEIFYQYCDKGYIDKDIFRQYLQNATLNMKNLERTLQEVFYKYDKDKDEKLNFNEFMWYYVELINNDEETSWIHIKNLDYRYDLQKCDATIENDSGIFYLENEKSEFMPRYFLSNDKEYFNKIFELMNHKNNEISEMSNLIIQMIETNNVIYNQIIESKFEDIVNESNLHIKNYSYQIILSILEKKEEKNEEWRNDFINNSLYHLINNFINYNEETYSNSFIQFICVCIKIIDNCITEIINDQAFINYLKNNSNENENENYEAQNIEKYELKLSEEQKKTLNNLSLNKILLKIFTILEDLSQNEKAYNQFINTIKIVLKLITIIMIIGIENEKNLFDEYLKNILSLNKDEKFYCLQNFLSSTKLILNHISESKRNEIINFEKVIRKEILNIESLSKMNNINFIFTFYENLILIGLKDNYEKLNEILNKFIEILLNVNNIPSEEIFIHYLSIIKEILSILQKENYKIKNFNNEKILSFIIDNYLINDINDKKLNNFSSYQSNLYNKRLFEIIKIIISLNPIKNIKLFLQLPKIKNITNYLSFNKEKKNYNPNLESKSTNSFLGINNLCSICYMISVIQQFFMIPLFKQIILTVETNKENEDNILFQLQKMFYYLNYSNRKFYSPETFVYSFKDYEGNPTNINIQCDAQEFLLRFIDQIENLLKKTKYKYLMNSIFGGVTCQSLKCKNENCENVNKKKENIYYLSLDIKNCNNLIDCLNKYISEENIEDYICDKCKNKITHVKTILLENLPNILIIHLKRISFNYEIFQNEKINSRIEFENKLNIKNYTIDKNDKSKKDENYEYNLIGIVVHSGTAQFGHYYSVINSKLTNEKGPWFKFNDMNVSEYLINNFEKDMFGGEIGKKNNLDEEYKSSAYMLIYEKKIKNVVLVDVINKNLNKNRRSYNKNNYNDFNDEDIEVFDNEKDVFDNIKIVEKNGEIVHIKNNNEYVKLVNYEDAIDYINDKYQKLDNSFVKEINEDNSKFCNDKRVFCQFFNELIEDILNKLKVILDEDKNKENEINTYINTINSFIFSILLKSYYKSNLEKITNILIEIYILSKNILSSFIDNYLEPQKEIILNNLLIIDKDLNTSISNYISKSISEAINKDIYQEKIFNIINYFLSIIPVELSKKWNCMFYYNQFLLNLIKENEQIKAFCLNNNLISKCIDFILGEESPIYKDDKRTSMKNIKVKFEPLVEIISVLYDFSRYNNTKLSDDDIKCIECEKFYKKIIENNYNNYSLGKIISIYLMDKKLIFEYENSFINNLLKYIITQKISNISTTNEAIELLNLIYEILKNNNDDNEEFSRIINQIFLGIPVLNTEQNNLGIKFFSAFSHDIETIIYKISTLFSNNKEYFNIAKIFLSLILESNNVFNYLQLLPSLNNFNNTFIQYFINRTENIIEKTKILKEKNEDENLINAKEVLEIIQKIKKKYSLINEKIINDRMYAIKVSSAILTQINNFLIIYSENIEYIIDEYNGKINLNNVDFYKKQCKEISTISNRIISDYDSLILKNKDDYKMIKRYFLISNTNCELILSYPPFIDYDMVFNIKKDKVYEIIALDIILNKEKINNKNLTINKVYTFVNKNDNQISTSNYEEKNNKDVDMEKCVINCSVCGEINEITENSEMKCKFCQSDLF